MCLVNTANLIMGPFNQCQWVTTSLLPKMDYYTTNFYVAKSFLLMDRSKQLLAVVIITYNVSS